MDVLVMDSDSDSYTETSEIGDNDETESSYGGHAQNILSSLDESISKIDEFLEFERGFLHGDIVCSTTDTCGQFGRVIDVDMVVDLEALSGEIIKDVSSTNLSRVRSFVSGDYVVFGSWIGRVTRAFDVVSVVFNDRSQCDILVKDSEVLKALNPIHFDDAPCFYYPGQHVRVDLQIVSKSARWLCGPWKACHDEGIVSNVEVGLVHVHWLSSLAAVYGIRSVAPPNIQEPKHLTLLSCFPYANWQLGDWCILSSGGSQNMSIGAEKFGLFAAPRNNAEMKMRVEAHSSCCKQPFAVAKKKSTVNVLWQNGNLSFGLDPQTLQPVSNLGDHDFWPEQIVLEKASSEDPGSAKGKQFGVVRKFDAVERTVIVKWIQQEITDAELSEEEIVSAYELVEHPDFSYCLGEVVFMMLDNKLPAIKSALRMELTSDCTHASLDFLSYIGIVIGYEDGHIKVKWASGVVSEVQPFEIIGLERAFDISATALVNEERVPTAISEDVLSGEQLQVQEISEEFPEETDGSCVGSLWKSTAFLFSKGVVEFITSVAANIICPRGLEWSQTVEEASKYEIVSIGKEHGFPDDLPSGFMEQPQNFTEHAEKQTLSQGADNVMQFKQFDVVEDLVDHHFRNENNVQDVKRCWLKKIRQEWNILQNDLPDSIYVRVCEKRMDLLRACVIGAAGTPYHDGLFFFDISFPPDYPQEPPLVHYISGGLRLNPNLYESGKVCLSLLKTWTGTGTEVWNSETSTVLQLLLSLQALVLNEKPYFNEAGYDKQIGRQEGEKNSITYNENAFLLSCKSMMYLLQKPPKHFEKLVEEHFADRSHKILWACEAYLGGALIGHAFDSRKALEDDEKSCSTGFKIMLMKLLPKLASAFSNQGIDCSPGLSASSHACGMKP